MLLIYQTTAAILAALFAFYGMDVRSKAGTRDFVGRGWQGLMKLCAFGLIAGFAWAVAGAGEVRAIDWIGLALAASGTAFVAAAKRALGSAHTFTGQCLERPQLVTHGIYARTRNPLYFGVFQCELGALLVVAHQALAQSPYGDAWWLAAFAGALAYAVAFNWNMARREARYLEHCFGANYRRYAAQVPFLLPISPRS